MIGPSVDHEARFECYFDIRNRKVGVAVNLQHTGPTESRSRRPNPGSDPTLASILQILPPDLPTGRARKRPTSSQTSRN